MNEQQISQWLSERSVPEDPYRSGTSAQHYIQFHVPSRHRRLEDFLRNYYERIIPDSDSLIHVTDWGLYQPSEMIAIAGIRSSMNEQRPLIEAPGHCLTPEESEMGVALFRLTTSFAWSSYLYCPTDRSSLYNWEGEIFDFWTDSIAALEELKLLLKQFELEETN